MLCTSFVSSTSVFPATPMQLVSWAPQMSVFLVLRSTYNAVRSMISGQRHNNDYLLIWWSNFQSKLHPAFRRGQIVGPADVMCKWSKHKWIMAIWFYKKAGPRSYAMSRQCKDRYIVWGCTLSGYCTYLGPACSLSRQDNAQTVSIGQTYWFGLMSYTAGRGQDHVQCPNNARSDTLNVIVHCLDIAYILARVNNIRIRFRDKGIFRNYDRWNHFQSGMQLNIVLENWM